MPNDKRIPYERTYIKRSSFCNWNNITALVIIAMLTIACLVEIYLVRIGVLP